MTDRDAAGPDWDARYAAAPPEGLFGGAPNLWLRMALAREGAPGTALFVADGDGRNGRFAALRGAAVTGLDLSAEATRRAEAADRAAGATVARVAADLTLWDPGARRWELCALLHLQGPAALRRAGLALCARAAAPGGTVLLEGFAVLEGRAIAGPGVTRPAARWRLAETLDWAAAEGLDPVEALEGTVSLDEGAAHQGAAQVVRLILKRKT